MPIPDTPQGYIAINCSEVDAWARIEIEGRGVGIPAGKHINRSRVARDAGLAVRP